MPLSGLKLLRLNRLLGDVLALPPSERAAWLDNLPEADRELETMLRGMLAEQAEGGSDPFLQTLPKLPAAPERDAGVRRSGDKIGAYRLLREVARGGMGSVWLAERADGSLRRQVALKLPHLAWGTGLAERMARERDIGVLLEHPHIARLYDAGVDQLGRPFLAFEYIDGVPIDAWCKLHALPLRARVTLFLQVAQAVAYAHARLVVHRDLKPSNVLVTADGQVHLLDFGIAKLLGEGRPGETGLTQLFGQAMTPHYASPEQLRSEAVTVASDVYSLGVVLFELLTGQRPHEPRRPSLAALEEAILQGEAPMASRRAGDQATARVLRGDLDAILAMALRREPERRYATVDALADDLQRHLAGETVRARPDTALYRMGKWLQRYQAGIALTSVTAFFVAGVIVAAITKAVQANDAATRAGAVKDFVLDTFRVETSGETADADPHRTPRQRMLERGARLIDARFIGQPQLQAELHGIVSGLFEEMAAFRLAERHATRRLEVLVGGEAPAAEKAAAAMARSQVLIRLGQPSAAEAPALEALRWAAGDRQLEVHARLQLVASLAAQWKSVRLTEELDRLEQQIARDLPGASIERALLLSGRASQAAMTDQPERAVQFVREAVATATSVEGPASDRVLNLRWHLWRMLIEARRVAEARDHGASIIADLRQLGGSRDSTAAFAEIYYTAQHYALDPDHHLSFEAAEATILADREIVQALGCRGIADAGAWSDYFLGLVYLAWHDFDRAEPLLATAIERIRATGEESMLIPHAGRSLAWAWIVRGDHARGERALRQEIEQMARERSPVLERTKASLAFSLGMRGRLNEALALLPPPSSTPADPRRLEIALIRAGLLIDNSQGPLALTMLPPAEAVATLPNGDAGRRGEALCASGHAAEGVMAFERHIAEEGGRRSPASPFVARSRAMQGLCALAAGDVGRAGALAESARRALRDRQAVSPYFHEPLTRLEAALAASPVTGRKS